MEGEVVLIVAGTSGVIAGFGFFLLLYGRYQYCVGSCALEPSTRRGAWAFLLAGGGLLLSLLLVASLLRPKP